MCDLSPTVCVFFCSPRNPLTLRHGSLLPLIYPFLHGSGLLTLHVLSHVVLGPLSDVTHLTERMDTIFGLTLIHRHFDIKPDKKLVKYMGTLTPWSGRFSGTEEPQPAIWAFNDEGLVRPTKFRYSKTQGDWLTDNQLEFISKFKDQLAARGLDNGIFGLARYPGDNFAGSCEITQGRANVNLQPKDVCNIPFFYATGWLKLCSIRPTWGPPLLFSSSPTLCGSEDAPANATRFPRITTTWGIEWRRRINSLGHFKSAVGSSGMVGKVVLQLRSPLSFPGRV